MDRDRDSYTTGSGRLVPPWATQRMASLVAQVGPARRARWLGASAALIALGAWWALRPPSPDTVLSRSVAALQAGDCEALVALAHPDEVRRLHITPASLRAALAQILWEHGRPKVAATEPLPRDPRPDHRGWEVRFAGDDPKDWRRSFTVHVLESPRHGWRLLLSHVIYAACWRKAGGPEGMAMYWTVARTNGITGRRAEDGSYVQPYEDVRKLTGAR